MITLPKTDLQVHPLCLGGNVFGFSADVDVRSMDMPRWMVVIFIPIGFLMMGVEFTRLLLKGESVLGDLSSALSTQKTESKP